MVYFDTAASAPVKSEVRNLIADAFYNYGNPSSQHATGKDLHQKLANARTTIKDALGVRNGEVIFTSGGSESNNAIIRMASELGMRYGKNKILVSATEHKSILMACRHMSRFGFVIDVLPVDSCGRVDPETLRMHMDSRTLLVSIMAVNNETGVINDIDALANVAHEDGALFHTDAVQALPHGLSFDINHVDAASFSGHKIGTPPGIGALYIGNRLMHECQRHHTALLYGGEQELGLRAGTENIPYILGFAKAIQTLSSDAHATEVRYYLEREILKILPNAKIHGAEAKRVGSISNIALRSVDASSVVTWMSMHNIMISSGSACNTGSHKPSHVLLAMGDTEQDAFSSIRLSFSEQNTKDEVDRFLEQLRKYADQYIFSQEKCADA